MFGAASERTPPDFPETVWPRRCSSKARRPCPAICKESPSRWKEKTPKVLQLQNFKHERFDGENDLRNKEIKKREE